MYESKKSEIYDMADVPTYEEVTLYRRTTGSRHRLAVLVGELKELFVFSVARSVKLKNTMIKKNYTYIHTPIGTAVQASAHPIGSSLGCSFLPKDLNLQPQMDNHLHLLSYSCLIA